MKQPSDWELLILPYLSNELSESEKERFKAHMAQHPDIARTVSEFRETLEMFLQIAPPANAVEHLEGIESRVYREIAARTTVRSRAQVAHHRLLRGMFGALNGEWWRTLTGGLVVATASVAIGVYVGMREVEPTPYSPVAQMTFVAPVRPASLEAEPHQKFMQSERERQLNEARLIHHVRRDARAALAHYAQIVEDNPESWTSRVAEFEQSALLNSVETTQPLLREDVKPVFTDVASR
jgi:anti-sigma factor RsiW